MKKKAAVITADGIGDGLLMMIASDRLLKEGYAVTTFNNHLHELSTWFCQHTFQSHPPIEKWSDILTTYSLVVAQNDNSKRTSILKYLYQKKVIHHLSLFYPTYEPNKHVLQRSDHLFNPNQSVVDNVSAAIQRLFHSKPRSSCNGIMPPSNLCYQKHPKRICIHPTSREKTKNWLPERFIKVAKLLVKQGYQPHFLLAPYERQWWQDRLQKAFPIPHLTSLSDLASYVYESFAVIGNDSVVGHLASNLRIPTIIISNCHKRMKLWRPGWLKGQVLTPSRFFPNCKPYRFRQSNWPYLIFPFQVLAALRQLQQQVAGPEKRSFSALADKKAI